jgi:hypothetical protein
LEGRFSRPAAGIPAGPNPWEKPSVTNSRRLRTPLLIGFLTCALGALPAHASDASEVGWGVGSALTTVVYGPLKLVYATMGLAFGGIGWAFSGGDPSVAEAVIAPAVRGDYVVTPAHLRGERRLAFVGMADPVGPPQVRLGRDAPQDVYEESYYDRAPR